MWVCLFDTCGDVAHVGPMLTIREVESQRREGPLLGVVQSGYSRCIQRIPSPEAIVLSIRVKYA